MIQKEYTASQMVIQNLKSGLITGFFFNRKNWRKSNRLITRRQLYIKFKVLHFINNGR